MKKFTATVLTALCTLGVLATSVGGQPAQAQGSSSALDRIKASGVLRVGTKTDYRPFGFLDPTGSIVGLEPDMAADLARRLNVKLELVPVLTSNRIEFLQQGRIDVMIATLSINEQRRKVVGYIEPFYYAGGTSLIVRKSAGMTRWEDVRNQKICGVQGAYYNRPLAQKFGAQIVAFPSSAEAENALLSGSCIGFVEDSTLLGAILASGDPKWAGFELPLPVPDLTPWGIAVKLENLGSDLGEFMRQTVTDWHRSGFLIGLEAKWQLPATEFLQQEQAKAKATGAH